MLKREICEYSRARFAHITSLINNHFLACCSCQDAKKLFFCMFAVLCTRYGFCAFIRYIQDVYEYTTSICYIHVLYRAALNTMWLDLRSYGNIWKACGGFYWSSDLFAHNLSKKSRRRRRRRERANCVMCRIKWAYTRSHAITGMRFGDGRKCLNC